MAEEIEGSKRSGTFTIADGKDIHGELTLAGAKTSLYLRDKEHFDIQVIPDQCLKGILHDLTKVSLIQCITPGTGSCNRGKEYYHFAEIFPHHVVYGDHHITPAEKTITDVHFVIDDATTLFYDVDAFGSLSDARPFIEQIANANASGRTVVTGPDPQIAYFSGKRKIFEANTIIGKVSASHTPSYGFGGPKGVHIKNTIFVTVSFNEAVIFDDTVTHVLTLLRYFEIIVGRPQNLLKMSLSLESDNELPVELRVYSSMPPVREPAHEEREPNARDILLDAVRKPDEFSKILESWLSRQETWGHARSRFSNCFSNQRSYNIDRLICAANIFDLLPSSAVPTDIPLSEDLKSAKESCRDIFDKLQPSYERDSVLGALGRLGKSNLKHKIRHRVQFLVDAVDSSFPEICYVTDKAVNCRNYYVHESKPDFDYNSNFNAVSFFTDTLEFVFAASDLIEAGWDIKTWATTGTTMTHPFASYRVHYRARLQQLKSLFSLSSV